MLEQKPTYICLYIYSGCLKPLYKTTMGLWFLLKAVVFNKFFTHFKLQLNTYRKFNLTVVFYNLYTLTTGLTINIKLNT
jgi:hypothetical protein